MPDVKAKALEWIKKGGGLALWEESKSGGAGWTKTLAKLRSKLESEQPKKRKVRKPIKIEQNLWNVGDVYAYQFNTDESSKYGAFGKFMILQKISDEPDFADELVMRVHVFDRLFDELPKLEDLGGIRLLPLDYPNITRDLRMSSLLRLFKKREYPADHLTFIGNVDIPANVIMQDWDNGRYANWEWFLIERWVEYFQMWQGLEYEMVTECLFKYTHKEEN